MTLRPAPLALLLAIGCTPAAAPTAAPAGTWAPAAYRATVDDALDAMFVANPQWATRVGDHRFDSRWPDLRDDAQARVAADFRARAAALRALSASAPETTADPRAGTDRPALDARILADRLDALAHELGTLRPLERDPSRALGIVGTGVTGLVDHDYAPKRARMDALATRLAEVPALLHAARARLRRPSRAALENLAIVARGMSGMLRGSITTEGPRGLETVPAVGARLVASAAAAAAAVDAYAAEVSAAYPIAAAKDDPIGAEAWATIARLSEGVDETPAEVRRLGEAELARLQGQLDALIKYGGGDPAAPGARAAFFAKLEEDTPRADEVLADYRAANAGVEAWMRSHRFATVPWEKAALEIVPTPPHQRGVSFASMNVAGALEPSASDARFQVNVPDASMPEERRRALLRFHAHGAIELVSVHEAIPGHYLQFLNLRRVPSRVRRLTGSSTFIEGWAHYCEQAAMEEGFTGRDVARTRKFYLRMALQRAARVVVDVAENDGSMSLEDGARFLVENAMLAPEAAKIEARRALVWPANMFTYTYGKLAILRLRERVKAEEGAAFDLVRFHDRLLGVGLVPMRDVGLAAFGLR
jgi:uncharacterized protein (DUF885 family)